MKLWKVLGIAFGLYGLIGPWIAIVGWAFATDYTPPSWALPAAYTFLYFQKWLLDIWCIPLNIFLWLLVGILFGLIIQRIKEMIK